jgi:hypothetical protein
MRFFCSFLFISLAIGRALEARQQSSSVTTWMTTQESAARSALFRNIGNTGEFAKSVDAGAVIASPSTGSPD